MGDTISPWSIQTKLNTNIVYKETNIQICSAAFWAGIVNKSYMYNLILFTLIYYTH